LKKRNGIVSYILSDLFSAALTWMLFYIFRKLYIEKLTWNPVLLYEKKLLIGTIAITTGWLLLNLLLGTYVNIYRKSRLSEVIKTFIITTVGCIIIFFAFILNDKVTSYSDYYVDFFVLFFTQLLLTILGRIIVLNRAKRRMKNGKFGFHTLIIGGNQRAVGLYNEINSNKKVLGYKFVGFIDTNGNSSNGLSSYIPNLGKLKSLGDVLKNNSIDEVIIAIETSEHNRIHDIINLLAEKHVVIKIIPDMYDILSGSVKMNHVLGAALIEIYPELMPQWQNNFKRIIDVSISALVLILLSPLILFVAIRVLFSSKGAIIYRQQRIGLHGKPFYIYKFRSMVSDAESEGPKLAVVNDPRITHWGKIMRKWRLDELPQFYNVILGDMALVGPRPEREHYISQIIIIEPDYIHLQKVKPGITSWGMVKFGYAENIQQMVERVKYDLIYIENMSLANDFRIMLYTTLTILQGRGR
jgi:exopolysaccharide biosynthesis polyprenyl glycosylphosphotransferase